MKRGTSAPQFTRRPFASLQRKCACGGSGSAGGECAECKRKRNLRQGASGEVMHVAHNFGLVRVHDDHMAAVSTGPSIANAYTIAGHALPHSFLRSYSSPATFQVPEDAPVGTEDPDGGVVDDNSAVTQQNGDDGSEANGDGSQGPSALGSDSPPANPGAGGPLCLNGGGDSSCNFAAGEYQINHNYNTCCTRDCTQQHEARHVQDLGDCCKKASAARTSSANPGKVLEMYNRWLEQARPRTECNAYRNDVTCATAMEKANDCNGKGKDSACCLSILSYKNRYRDEAEQVCKAAPAKIPPCPNFDLASVLP